MASQHITEEAVYLCTGNPMPKDIEQISFWLLNEPFSDSFKRNWFSLEFSILFWFVLLVFIYLFVPILFSGISEIKTRKGLALVDIVREVTMWVLYLILYDFWVMIFAWLSQMFYSCRFVFKIKMPPDVRVQLINDLADIEYASISLLYIMYCQVLLFYCVEIYMMCKITSTIINLNKHWKTLNFLMLMFTIPISSYL